jgi:SAM-dependent methyltransferase
MIAEPKDRCTTMTSTTPNTSHPPVDEPTVPISRALIDALDAAPSMLDGPCAGAAPDRDEQPVSVWATAQTSAAAQRKGRYVPESTAHPAKMLPAVAAHAIEHYTRPGEIVLDPMCGIGTTLVEAIDLERRAVGVEYEPHWADIAQENLRFARERGRDHDGRVVRGDARQLATLLPPEYVGQVALVVTSPPYGPSVHGLVKTDREPGVDKVRKRHYRYGSALDRGNLANVGHHRLLAGFTRILTACAHVLRPGGHVAITVRPWREHAELIDLPSQIIACGRAAGLIPVERCVALLARVADTDLVVRGSFFQRDFIRKQREQGLPLHLIAHEDVIILRSPGGRGHEHTADEKRPVDVHHEYGAIGPGRWAA